MSRVGSEARLGPPLHRLSLATTRSEPSRTRGTRVQIVLEATFGSRLVRPPGRPRKQVFLRRGARQVPLPAPVGLHHVDRCGCLHRRVATSEDDLPPVGRQAGAKSSPAFRVRFRCPPPSALRRRPRGWRRAGRRRRSSARRATRRSGQRPVARQPQLPAPVRVHDVDLDVPAARVPEEGDPPPVGRPGRSSAPRGARQQLPPAPVGVHGVEPVPA
jgi:hypothetical protein